MILYKKEYTEQTPHKLNKITIFCYLTINLDRHLIVTHILMQKYTEKLISESMIRQTSILPLRIIHLWSFSIHIELFSKD